MHREKFLLGVRLLHHQYKCTALLQWWWRG